jgi:TRAP-type C4-dicarboxylate transport system substrate-binding protein
MVLAAWILLAARAASAAPVVIKLATQIPENSPIGHGILKLAGEWKRVSKGEVILKTYMGGALGDDESMRQKLGTKLIDGIVVTNAGMAPLVPEFMALSAPSLIRDEGEVAVALEAIRPVLDKRLSEKGLVPLAIIMGGWIRFFSRAPIASPDDLKSMRFSISPYDVSLLQLFKVMGVNVVTVPYSLQLQKFQSGAVDVMFTSPVYFSYQWSSYAKVITSMTDVPICPFLGCLVLRADAWETVPAGLRADLSATTATVAAEMETEMLEKEKAVMKELSSYGLKIIKPTREQYGEWMEIFSRAVESERSDAFPREGVDVIRRALEKRRAGKR